MATIVKNIRPPLQKVGNNQQHEIALAEREQACEKHVLSWTPPVRSHNALAFINIWLDLPMGQMEQIGRSQSKHQKSSDRR